MRARIQFASEKAARVRETLVDDGVGGRRGEEASGCSISPLSVSKFERRSFIKVGKEEEKSLLSSPNTTERLAHRQTNAQQGCFSKTQTYPSFFSSVFLLQLWLETTSKTV